MPGFLKRYSRSKLQIIALIFLTVVWWSWHRKRIPLELSEDLIGPGHTQPVAQEEWTLLPQDLATAKISISVVLPVKPESISQLENHLDLFLETKSNIHEVIIICLPSLVGAARNVIKARKDAYIDEFDITIHPLIGGLDYTTGLLDAASHAISDWVLLTNQHGLLEESNYAKDVLLHPPTVSLPLGIRGCGVFLNQTYAVDDSRFFRAKRLHLPFLIPSHLAVGDVCDNCADVWSEIANRLAERRLGTVRGLIFDANTSGVQCPEAMEMRRSHTTITPSPNGNQLHFTEALPTNQLPIVESLSSPPTSKIAFTVMMPTPEDLHSLSPTLCALQDKGHRIQSFVSKRYGPYHGTFEAFESTQWIRVANCTVTYLVTSTGAEGWAPASDRVEQQQGSPELNVLISLKGDVSSAAANSIISEQKDDARISLTREELPHTLWMASLSPEEWTNWNRPNVEISIITNNRPQSLKRLLNSLSRGLFFGDVVDVQLYLEQTADQDTLDISSDFLWPHGEVYEHHRIAQGGLMAAVVESWYPHTNDSYGLLLEDDTEVSPLFYAWVKMNILKYRYGKPNDRSSKVFGLSLYQQKVIELRPEGRRAFNARELLSSHGNYDPLSPYLSPIPCSWGAVYFPEHWKGFHSYLLNRLSEKQIKLPEVVVPDLRSNKWSRSWKKYFIEFAFLRGLVMIYPNYPSYFSFSTNHLELGSHVKARTAARKDLFLLPLMPLNSQRNDSLTTPTLLTLPNQALPAIRILPVFNLTGDITTLARLEEQGLDRCKELKWCP